MATRVLVERIDLAIPSSIIFNFISTGVEHPELKFIASELRAALALVRSRKLAELGEKSAEMLAKADRLDVGKGIVARAREAWPPIQKEDPKPQKGAPKPPEEVVTLTLKKAGAQGSL